MQNIILGYADRVRERVSRDHVSIGAAAAAFISDLEDGPLEGLARAADDLQRLIELEQQRRQDDRNEGRRMVCCGELR